MAEDYRHESSRSAPASPRAAKLLSRSTGANGHLQEQNGRLTAAHQTRTFGKESSIVLVGVRGSGKRSLGLIAATTLGRRFLTEDHFFERATGLTRQDYLKVHGSEEFHKQDVEITKRMLEENRFNCVIDCGLGSLTSNLQEYLKQYCLTNPVIYLLRDMDQIRSLLNLGERSARLLEAGDPSHRKCSNFEYYNLQEPSLASSQDAEAADRASPNYSFKLRQAQEDFSRYVRFITGSSEATDAASHFSVEAPILTRAYTHALEVPLSAFEHGIDIERLHTAGDVVEVIVDKWSQAAVRTLTRLVAMVRRFVGVPILYSVRVPNVAMEIYLAILKHGLRLGVDYLSVDLSLDIKTLGSVLATRGRTKVIGTHFTSKNADQAGWRDVNLKMTAEHALALRCDAMRIAFPASSTDDLTALGWFREEMKARGLTIIAYNTGPLGRTSQILNTSLTPVTHEALMSVNRMRTPWPVLTSKVALKALFDCFVLDPLSFCIVGGNVTQSLSPPMHNAAYASLGLQHSYETKNITAWSDIEALAKNDHFGGASVVQPWKVRIVEKVASLGHHGKAIGAVNTLIPLRAGSEGQPLTIEDQAFNRNRAGPIAAWHAENTDWLGIRVCLSRNLSPRNVIQPKTAGLVIGAGGMARAAVYALLMMGCRNVFVYNRTVSNAHSMATHFNNWLKNQISIKQALDPDVVKVLESLEQPWPANVNLPTMVVSCVTHEVLDGNPGSDFEMPKQWLHSPSGGVVVEMAYMTSATSLIKQMKEFRQTSGLPWVIVDGIETLIEQAIGQFEIMTGRKAPRKIMTAAIRAALRENQQYVADGEVFDNDGSIG